MFPLNSIFVMTLSINTERLDHKETHSADVIKSKDNMNRLMNFNFFRMSKNYLDVPFTIAKLKRLTPAAFTASMTLTTTW